MRDIRHDLHRHPELSFAEHRTTAVICERLRELGWALLECPTETGAVAHLAGRGGRHVLVRADIDALPVQEESDVDFASVVPGVMHACGHDVHTAAALGVADVLARLRAADELVGSYTLVFQPAEEGLGGARAMIEGGLLETLRPDVAIGAHVASLAPVGVVATRPGVLMSQAHAFAVELTGTGGHGAMATSAGNVVLAASALAPRLGEVVAGLEHAGVACACSAGVLAAGTAPNVVPRRGVVRGTLRTFSAAQADEALARLGALVEAIAGQFEVSATLQLNESTPAVINDEATEAVVVAALEDAPELMFFETPPVTPSDDVAEFLNRVPGCYLLVGGAPPGGAGMHHAPDFAIDDEALRRVARAVLSGALALAQIG